MKTDNGWRIRWEKWDKAGPSRTGTIPAPGQPLLTLGNAQAELKRLRYYNAKAIDKGEVTYELEHVPVIMIIEDEDSFASIVKRERKRLWERMLELKEQTFFYSPSSDRKEIPDLWPEDLLEPILNPSLSPNWEVTTEFNIYRDEGGSSA